ncbi:MAG: hypothetical protein ACKVIQ_08020 [Acidimicrobiales bacterium]
MDDPKQTSGTFEQGPAGVGAFSSLLLAPQERVVAHAEDQLDDVQTEHAEDTEDAEHTEHAAPRAGIDKWIFVAAWVLIGLGLIFGLWAVIGNS